MDNYKKEGQMAGGAVSNIITLVVGVGVSVLILTFVGALGGKTFELVEADIDAIANNAVTSESFTANNLTAQSLNHGFIQTGTLSITNGTLTGNPVGLGNFTIDYDAGTLLLSTSGAFHATYNGSTMYANYTWGAREVRESVKDGIVSGFEALEQTGDYLPIIVLAVIIALVLSLVLGFMLLGRRDTGGTAL